MTGIQARTVTNGTIGKTACRSPCEERPREAIHQLMCAGRCLVATPGNMLVRADNDEGMRFLDVRARTNDVHNAQWNPAVCFSGFDRELINPAVRSNNRVARPQCVVRRSSVVQPDMRKSAAGTIDGVSLSIEYAGAGLTS